MIKQIAFVRGTITNEYAWKDKFHFMVVIGPKERVAKTSKCLEKAHNLGFWNRVSDRANYRRELGLGFDYIGMCLF